MTREELLDALRANLEARQECDRLLDARNELFAEARDMDPPIPIADLAEAAGCKSITVSVALTTRRKRLHERGEADPYSERYG